MKIRIENGTLIFTQKHEILTTRTMMEVEAQPYPILMFRYELTIRGRKIPYFVPQSSVTIIA